MNPSCNRVKMDETKPDEIKEKLYITREIETSITLLASPENNVVLEALLFLSKYADIQTNNVRFIQAHGLLPKLLALLDHNICILRLSLRLLSLLLTVNSAKLELNQEIFEPAILKICQYFVSHDDIAIKEFTGVILKIYTQGGYHSVLLDQPQLMKTLLRAIKTPETDTILDCSLEMFSKFLENETVRQSLPSENFHFETFINKMHQTDQSMNTILTIFEKITFFGEDLLRKLLKECRLVEKMIDIIIDPDKENHLITCLTIIMHCMEDTNTNRCSIESLEFLKFCRWAKTCPDHVMSICARIFLALSKIDDIRQILFDLSVENTILSFLRTGDKTVLNIAFEAISYMSRHKYCCGKMCCPIVIKKLLSMLESDNHGSQSVTALRTLHYFCRRDPKTVFMIEAYKGVTTLFKFLEEKPSQLEVIDLKRVLDITNMFVTNNQLQSCILCSNFYDAILTHVQNKFDEICIKSLEILINCLNQKEFQNYFLSTQGFELIANKLSVCRNEKCFHLIIVFIHNSLQYKKMGCDLVHHKMLLILKAIPDSVKEQNPLISRSINLIYRICLPIKFFETGRLDLVDRLNERFYVINGCWSCPFPFLEILEMRQICTVTTIYVVLMCEFEKSESLSTFLQASISERSNSLSSDSREYSNCCINYGKLSLDPYLPKYVCKIKKLLSGIVQPEAKIKILAHFVDDCLCGPNENCTTLDKKETFKRHLDCIKEKLGTNMIPIGYLRLGFHCEKALLFKALADHAYIPATLVKGKEKLYWNEVALIQTTKGKTELKMFVVDLMNNIGRLLLLGSKDCHSYCNIQLHKNTKL